MRYARTANKQEVHIMHPFAHDFYGHEMSVLILGYIRPELDYVSKGMLAPVPANLSRGSYSRYSDRRKSRFEISQQTSVCRLRYISVPYGQATGQLTRSFHDASHDICYNFWLQV